MLLAKAAGRGSAISGMDAWSPVLLLQGVLEYWGSDGQLQLTPGPAPHLKVQPLLTVHASHSSKNWPGSTSVLPLSPRTPPPSTSPAVAAPVSSISEPTGRQGLNAL